MILGKKNWYDTSIWRQKISASNCNRSSIKFCCSNKEGRKEGYNAIALGFEDKREKLVNKPEMGVFKKAGITPKRFVKEFHVASVEGYELGQELTAQTLLEGVEFVDIQGVSKGKGTAGVMKRHNFGGNRATHGFQETTDLEDQMQGVQHLIVMYLKVREWLED